MGAGSVQFVPRRSLAMLRLEGAGFWPSMAWVEPGHASLGGCWHGAQIAPTSGHVTSQLPFSLPAEALLGAGRSQFWFSMAWVKPGHASLGGLDSGSAWHGWSLAMLRLEGAGTVLRSLRPPATSRASYLSVCRLRPCWELAVLNSGSAW